MCRIIEELVGDGLIASTKPAAREHPARVMHDVCARAALSQEHGSMNMTRADYPIFALAMRACFTLVKVTAGNVEPLRLGAFANYGDPRVQRRLRAVVRNPHQFLDVLTELQFAMTCRAQGGSVTAYENEGYPDFEAVIPGLDYPIIADCKRIAAGTSSRAIKDDITHANKQIKRLGKRGYGLVVVDASTRIHDTTGTTDAEPVVVGTVYRDFRGAISTHNRSVSGVLLTWDLYNAEQLPMLHAGFRSRLFLHADPKMPIPSGGPGINHALSIILFVKESFAVVPEQTVRIDFPSWLSDGSPILQLIDLD
jgi:hypothetical protein